ncbi:RluA family pseudouridine synthase [Maribacter hydrothermalis]|nr:RluA family pseudouridine synthase [Maribacter hydrothermalis]
MAVLSNDAIRLQEYGVGVFERIATKSALKKAIKKKMIFVNDKVATTATFIKEGDKIEYRFDQNDDTRKKFRLKLPIIYEDDYLAIINKPAGIVVSGNNFKTVANALCQNLNPSSIHDAAKPQPAHRLDFATTGLLLIGKTSSVIKELNRLFEFKEVQKSYYAVTIGAMEPKGEVNLQVDDKEACSIFEVLETIPSIRFNYLNLVKLSPKTGRRHQLRKHMLAIGNPILGDATYFKQGLMLKGKGLYLHAQSLQFIHPKTYQEMYVDTTLPVKFNKLFRSIS